MTKIRVFIDFEAISAPFSYDLNIKNDLPYAYSIGIHVGKKFKTRTTIINFNNISTDGIYEYIRLDIIDKLRDMIDNKQFKVNRESIEFIGWAPNLEKKILNKAFRGIEVKDQTKGQSISLSTLTNKEFENVDYFPNLKKQIKKKIDNEFITKRGLNLDGAIAALAGYELYRISNNMNGKWRVDLDVKELISEIITYSKDDIKRMSFLDKNPNIFHDRKIELIKKNKVKQRISSKLSQYSNLSRKLNNFDKTMTVEELQEHLDKEIVELKKQKDNL